MTRTILIVDDDPMIRKLIATTLEDLLVASLADESDFARAIAEHQAAMAGRREFGEIRARRLSVPRRSGPRAAAGAAARTA